MLGSGQYQALLIELERAGEITQVIAQLAQGTQQGCLRLGRQVGAQLQCAFGAIQ